MCNWKKWIWPGILATVLLTALALLMQARAIEQDLHSKVMTDLTGSYDWAELELDGRDLTLRGVAPSEDAVSEALQLSDDAYDVRVAKSLATLLPISDPFALSATKADNKIVLDGSVADDASRVSIVDAAKAAYPGAEVVDNLALARGAPEGFAQLAGFGISQLATLEKGTVSLSGLDLSVKGAAKDLPTYNTVVAALSGILPAGGKLAVQDISVPAISPYVLSATKSAEGIVLEGFVPNEEIRGKLNAAAKMATSAVVTDNLSLGAGMPEGFGDLAGFGISQMASLDNGTVSLSDMNLNINGAALDKPAFDTISSALAGAIPAGGKIASQDISVPSISPFTLSAVKSADGIVLEGYVSDEATRAAMVAAAKSATNGNVTDNLKLGAGAPDGYGDLAAFGVGQLAGFSNGSASLSGMDLSLKGTAQSSEAYETVTAALAGKIPANGKLVLSEITRNSVSPYTLSVTKDAGSIAFEGYVGSEAEKAAALASASEANPGLKVEDRLKIALGAPSGLDWSKATALAIKEASQFSAGTATLNNGEYSLEGMAKTNADYDLLVGDSQLPEGLGLAGEKITRPAANPYVWSLTRMENSAPVLSGYAPDQEFVGDNLAKIKAAMGADKEATNNLEFASGAPKDLAAVTAIGINSVGRLINGKAEIDGMQLTVTGEASDESVASQVRKDVETALPAGYSGKHAITVRPTPVAPKVEPAPAPAPKVEPAPAPEPVVVAPAVEPLAKCQDDLRGELVGKSIGFEVNKAIIKPESYGLLDALADIIKQCSSGIVEIEGHTDSDGADDYNMTLSQDRAEAVRAYMIKAGIASSQMKAIGYGETKPVADNSTPEGKALNRRIEFTVKR